MGAPVVRRNEFEATLEEIRVEFGEQLSELTAKLHRIESVLEIDELGQEIDEFQEGLDSGDPTGRLVPATDEESLEPAGSTKEALEGSDKEAHPAAEDPEGIELVEKIHERKSRAKRKPEGQDPLGLVPDPEEADS